MKVDHDAYPSRWSGQEWAQWEGRLEPDVGKVWGAAVCTSCGETAVVRFVTRGGRRPAKPFRSCRLTPGCKGRLDTAAVSVVTSTSEQGRA